MKWSSVLFSDLRNKLGNQIIGTNWKGRGVFRAYKKPSNPNSLAQQANRDHNKKAVSAYQNFVGTDAERQAEWNAAALSRLISGFNLFLKYARKTILACDATYTGGVDCDLTYTAPVDLADMAIFTYAYYSGAWHFEYREMCVEGDDQVYSLNTTGMSDTIYFYIGPKSVFDELTGDDQFAVRCAHWKPNVATGVADAAESVPA